MKVSVETKTSTSIRARQVSSMFDVEPTGVCRLEWEFDVPLDAAPWKVGLIVGPSGSGKSTVGKHLFGEVAQLEWAGSSVIDDFPASLGVQEITSALGAVGFNSVPAWLRPYSVLSNGEKFRVEVARRLLGHEDLVVIDEFTSVVDRQVAQVGSHAIQKFVRRSESKRFVGITCHYDLQEWLQPDWVLDMATRTFTRRLLQRRPSVECELRRVDRSVWPLFAPFHYLSAELAPQCRCFGIFVGGRIVGFAGVLHRPVSTGDRRAGRIFGLSRNVVLPDWQGLGLSAAANDILGAAYKAFGDRYRSYPANPAVVRQYDRARHWALMRKPSLRDANLGARSSTMGAMGGRTNAVFEYIGPAMERAAAAALLERTP